MAELFRRLRSPPPAPAVESDENLEYSFALEYRGPPVAYDLPRAVPIDIDQVPTAAVVAGPASLPDRRALPVIQPLPSPDPPKRQPKDEPLAPDPVVSPTSVIAFQRAGADGRGRNSPGGVGSSGDSAPSSGSRDSLPEIDSSGALELADGEDGSCVLSGEFESSGDQRGGSRELSPGSDESCVVEALWNGRDWSCELLGEIGSSGDRHSKSHESLPRAGVEVFSNGQDWSFELLGGTGSSGELDLREFSSEKICSEAGGDSNRFEDRSGELADEIESSGVPESSHDCKDRVDFSNDMNLPEWQSTEFASLPFMSTNSSQKADDFDDVLPAHGKRGPLVTFIDTHSSGKIETESSSAEIGVTQERSEGQSRIKKGSCHRCLKRNRFTEKETCMVCKAKYCSSCVLRAMGSMPEGRKCVTCIGYPIDESKRASLGKCSRMLKRLLSPLEIQLAMKAEKFCRANQLQPEHVYVNRRPLCRDEMVLLHSGSNPLSKLKPGRYWYDKVSGLWGKEGQKPSLIISPHLNVGGELQQDASNGNTKVFINNREITKVELKMLKWAGVQCAGNPQFWLEADGSYQEEGQKNIRGNIWGKPGTRLVCTLLALPVPKMGVALQEAANNGISRNVPDYLETKLLQRLLLIGCDGAGTSTIFKQAKFLYQKEPFSEEEQQNIKYMIQSKVYYYLGILLEGRERFEEESLMELQQKGHIDEGKSQIEEGHSVYSICPRLKDFSAWLLKVMVAGNLEAIFPAATREYAPTVEDLWKDPAIQATYRRRNELQTLPSVASYFLERVVDISKMEYEPSNKDILYAESITSSNGLTYTDFFFPPAAYDSTLEPMDQHDPLLRYELIRVHVRGLGENCKWLEMFEDVRIAIFCVSLSDYDQFCNDETGVPKNMMLVSRKLFESVVSHPTFEEMDFLLILNKFDLLEQKIEQVPLTVCEWFEDFNPVTSRHRPSNSKNNGVSLGQQAFHYIAVKFRRLFSSLTGQKLYVSQTNALDEVSVDQALRYAREIIKWEEDRAVINNTDYSIYSTEASSSH